MKMYANGLNLQNPKSTEDTLDHRCWEVSETWLRNNIIFWDKDVLEITNAWRAKRGDKILTREDLTGE